MYEVVQQREKVVINDAPMKSITGDLIDASENRDYFDEVGWL
ncbi:MAG TPA: hypothetical protein PLX30_12055 [Methanothrix sp.]|nr:hypothetical protein [Methanothrix sp.]